MNKPVISTKLLVILVGVVCLLGWLRLAPSRSMAVSISAAPGVSDQVTGQEELATDDGTVETGTLTDGLIVVNRLTPSNYPATLQTIRIFFVQFQGFPSPAGAQIRLIAFAGAAGSTQPTSNPTLLVNQVVTVPAVSASGGFIDFPIQNGPTINGGDFYVGFQAPTPTGGVIFAADVNGSQQQRGFYSTDNGALYQGPLILVIQQQAFQVNIMIRAVVSEEVPNGPSITVQPASVDFGTVLAGSTGEQTITVRNTGSAPLNLTGVTVDNTQFSVTTTLPLTIAPSSQQTITARFSPTGNGAQKALLTITSDDPAKPAVSVTLTGSGDTVILISGTAQTGSIAAPTLSGVGVLDTTQFTILVPNGATQLKVDLTGNQDVDLYVRFGQRIAIANGGVVADATSETAANFESVTITPASSPALQAGTYFIAVSNFGLSTANFTLTATITGGNQVVTVSAASFSASGLASEAIASAFGPGLATMTAEAMTIPLPTSLAGTTLMVKDSAGTERPAPLFFVSATQINYLIPPGTASGTAIVTVISGNGSIASGAIQVEQVSPGLFTFSSDGQGVVAAVVRRFRNNQELFPSVLAVQPIDLGPETDLVILEMFGTGLRFHSLAASSVTIKIGGADGQLFYAGLAPGFVGLDQVDVSIPRSLIGRGDVDIVLTADGKPGNTVKVGIK